jgi:hypothetical protein
MFKNQLELSIADWLWDVWNGNHDAFTVPFKEGDWQEIRKLDIDNEGEFVVVKTKSFALVYKNNGAVPSRSGLEAPLPDDYFTDDGDWDDEAVWNKLNQFATLVEIYRI